MRPWSELSDKEQIALREDYAKDPFCLTGTCSLEAKTEDFTRWLAARGVLFRVEDLHPGK
ncbi:hypothetical protein L2U69_04455 [Zavarzinia compransoris]|uniref:hypothetical protein n=1 Tax=Zavarzinia marina TaxID=2911065 RepID=UPI001F2C23BC|nr:hypothetical protein [Zavarzinia marina]MCF4164888.1 hypothetical protein [Zavarzinia marina]